MAGQADTFTAQLRSMIRQRYFPENGAGCGINALLGSHDQVGCRKNGGKGGDGRLRRYFIDRVGGKGDWNARAKTRMWWSAAAAGVVSGVPMLFMGTETLQGGWWHTDQMFQWGAVKRDGNPGCPFADQMMALVKASLKLRKDHPSLVTSNPDVVLQDVANVVFGVKRGKGYLAVINTGDNQWVDNAYYSINVGETTGGMAKQIFNSQAAEFGGWHESWTSAGKDSKFDIQLNHGSLSFRLPKRSVVVFQFGQ